MRLSDAKRVQWGATPAKAVYLGGQQVWTGFTPVVATGGDEVFDTTVNGINYRYHKFTTVGTSAFSVSSAGEVEYFVVGGGGGGLNGGGGGGYTTTGTFTVAEETYAVSVGSGGASRTARTNVSASAGGQSSVFGFTAAGGLGAFNASGNNIREGGDGGSGGGASASSNELAGNGGSDGSDGGAGQRGDGGLGQGTTTREFGEAGAQLYGGGGGAGVFTGTPGVGGAGGGGNGVTGSTTGGKGVDGLGGGGGGTGGSGSTAPNVGGAGGSGIVIVRYPI